MNVQTHISIAQAELVLDRALEIFLDMEESLGFAKDEEFLDPRELTEAIRIAWSENFKGALDTRKMDDLF